MRNVLILDSNKKFLNDLEGRFLLDAPDDLDFILSSDFDNVEEQIADEDIELVVFNMEDYDYFLDFDFANKTETLSYAKNSEQLMHSQRLGISSLGIILQPKALIHKIDEMDIMNFDEESDFAESAVSETEENFEEEFDDTNDVNDVEETDFSEDIFDDFDSVSESENATEPVVQPVEPSRPLRGSRTSMVQNAVHSPSAPVSERELARERRRQRSTRPVRQENPSPREVPSPPERNAQTSPSNKSTRSLRKQEPIPTGNRPIKRQEPIPSSRPVRRTGTASAETRMRQEAETTPNRRAPAHRADAVSSRTQNVNEEITRRRRSENGRSVIQQPEMESEIAVKEEPKRKRLNKHSATPAKERMEQIQEVDRKERRRKETPSQLNQRLNREINKDLNIEKNPAKIITVYSAKGGVGKTTIACELATALALTDHGRGKLSVCIVDYNIDFGDVLNTLDYSPKKTCMSYWASDIREMLAGNQDKEVVYSQEEIRSQFLQHNDESGLYALLAPFTNEDSMNISEVELRIMLENLRDYGGFDYIICDTGNNTRDSSYIALELADEILMVLTQSVNTANCNDSFLTTMQKIHFDMNKFAIIINKVRPTKLVDISTEEIEHAFVNPNTGKSYPCYAKIKDNTDAMRANNLGRPLAYDSNHEITQQIRNIISKIVGDQFVLDMPDNKKKKKKKGLFGFFKK